MSEPYDFSEAQLRRYARHIVLREIGGEGQAKLLRARVLVIGAGGLGSPVLLYLAAAGIGHIGLIDDDTVDASNLQRQIIHRTDGIGMAKVDSAAAAIRALNPDVTVETLNLRLDADSAREIVARYDIVADGSDNFATRYAVNDACFHARVPLVSAAILQFDGQLATFKAYEGGDQPCYRCLHPQEPTGDSARNCSTVGVLGALAGTMGGLQATEVVKELLGIGDSMAGRLMLYDALAPRFHTIALKRRPGCVLHP